LPAPLANHERIAVRGSRLRSQRLAGKSRSKFCELPTAEAAGFLLQRRYFPVMFITSSGFFSAGLTFRRSAGSSLEYVYRRIEIPMHGCPAWAVMPPFRKRFLSYQTAVAAPLGGVGRIYQHDFATSFFRFVADHTDKLGPAAIQYGFCKETLCQSGNIQVFQCKKRICVNQFSAGFM